MLSSKTIEGRKHLLKSDLRGYFHTYGTLFFFLLLLVVNTFITPNFLSGGTLRNLLLQVYPIMLVALGMTLIISSGGIDISVGAIMSIAGSVTARLYNSGFGLVPSLVAGLLAACLCGLFNGVMVARFNIQPIVVTLIVMIAGRGLAQIILGELFLSFYGTPFADLGSYRIGNVIPIQAIIMLVFIAVIGFIVKTTVFARNVEAIGDNHRAARLAGVNIPLVLMGVYVIGGFLCGVAGIVEAARINAMNAADLGLLIELDAIAAVAIGATPFSGGKARVMGTVIGALIVQLVTIVVNMNNIQFHYSLVVKAIIIIVALYLQKEER